LAQQVANIAARLPPDDAGALADAYETLTKEATRDAPSREWWELSLQGIREAAQSVGAIGNTAIDLVGKLTPLILSG
jgi:hypothetical protein